MNFILQPKSSEDYVANLRAARVSVGADLGLSIKTGSPAEYAALSQADQIRLTDEVAAFIVANRGLFSPVQVDIAQRRANSSTFRTPLADTSTDAADFVRAYGETFGETVEGAAGIVGRSAGKLLGFNPGTLVLVLGGVAVLYFGAPYVIPQLRAAFAKK